MKDTSWIKPQLKELFAGKYDWLGFNQLYKEKLDRFNGKLYKYCSFSKDDSNHSLDNFKNDIIYFGPMGCRTGCYLIITGDKEPLDIYDLIKEMFEFILNYEGTIPGASAVECGNYLDLNLDMAKFYANKYINEVLNNFTKEKYCYSE